MCLGFPDLQNSCGTRRHIMSQCIMLRDGYFAYRALINLYDNVIERITVKQILVTS